MAKRCLLLVITLYTLVLLMFYVNQLHFQRARYQPLPAVPRYALSLDYSDQLTGSSINLLNLQCWAKQSGMLVVEPFIVRSKLGVSLQKKRNCIDQDAVKLSDIFDIDAWQQFSKEKGYSPLVSWEEFLSKAPRNVIIVAQPGIYDCNLEAIKDAISPLVTEYNFTIVRKICFVFRESVLDYKSYMTNLLGEYSAHDVTVIFGRWGGIDKRNTDPIRTAISDSRCTRNGGVLKFAAKSSESLSSDAKKYIMKYFNGSNSYTSVMIRFEYFFINHNMQSLSQQQQFTALDKCLKSISFEWRKQAKLSSAKNTFLTMDYGKYGSEVDHLSSTQYSWAREMVKDLFKDISSTSLSLSQWEESFESIATKKSPGYIAQLQKELAARGQCLLLAGSEGHSTFQQHAKALYQDYHGGSAECITTACSSARMAVILRKVVAKAKNIHAHLKN